MSIMSTAVDVDIDFEAHEFARVAEDIAATETPESIEMTAEERAHYQAELRAMSAEIPALAAFYTAYDAQR